MAIFERKARNHAKEGGLGIEYHNLHFEHRTSVVSKFIKLSEKEKPPVIYSDGSQTRDYVYVKDTVKGIKERPQVLITTGDASLAVPAFYLAKFLLRAKLIQVELLSRFDYMSNTGRYLFPILDRIFVQNPETLNAYRGKAEYYGSII